MGKWVRRLKRRFFDESPLAEGWRCLERLNILRLQALRALGDVELHRLALLQAFETTGLNGREMHENVFARLPANKAVTLGVVEPLYRSLFCHTGYTCSFQSIYAGGSRKYYWQVTAVEARLLTTDSV